MMNIYRLEEAHWPQVKSIYEQGIATGNATFETSAPEWQDWQKSHIEACRIVMVENGFVVGWAALTHVSGRCIYAGVAEVSVYVSLADQGKGIGNALLARLILESENNGFWTLQASIFPENIASLKIHQQTGFRIVGVRKQIGKMNGIWRDTILLERRSDKIGSE